VQEKVGFTGFLPDMPLAYRALDIVVHASTRPEPFGLVIVEAMACGRAVIATPTGGAAELFVDGQQALSAAPGDGEALAAAIRRLVDDPELRARLGARGRAHVVATFGRDRFAVNLNTALSRITWPPAERTD
jgi:glycosyltransferase involved in cell wall biosynthesis